MAHDGRALPHILTTSATMLGVCMTVLSLGQLDDDRMSYWLIDKLVAVAAILFLASSLYSFLSLRQSGHALAKATRYERRAEWVFMSGLGLLALGAGLLAFVVK